MSLKPLKILTLDGGGLQAISTLLILDDLLQAIAKQNGVHQRKPKPCEIFDVIAGIGAGGWLAVLLGRFRMDIVSCLSEWYRIMQGITPKTKTEILYLRMLKHCYFDPDRLERQVNHLTKTYGTGDFLFETNPEGARTRHVFVAALKSDAKGYNLFRTYGTDSAKLPKKLLEGPENPDSFRISAAFRVTGAARYFCPPWKEQMASGSVWFSDTQFPAPHNITELALDEVWGLYGKDVPLSIIINIGPGRPTDFDVRQIARRFSWGLKTPSLGKPMKGKRYLAQLTNKADAEEKTIPDSEPELLQVRFQQTQSQNSKNHPVTKGNNANRTDSRVNTFGDIKGRAIDEKLKRLEEDIENDISRKLQHVCPSDQQLYYRLALERSPQGTSLNDSLASDITHDATVDYLGTAKGTINEVARRIPEIPSTA